ncbi:LysR family transcriptional regulator [Leeia speluncae]|nr:LysR family transcriptional regulator [Leeia speluncae]
MNSCPPLDLLQTWVTVVELESVSKAAIQLRISQAAVSQQVRSLEEIIGVPLLDRSFRPARPTPAGMRLYQDAGLLIEHASLLIGNARNVMRAKGTIVKIGCVDSFAATIGPQLVKGLSNSSLKITLWSGITPVLDEQMNNRMLDVAITTEGSTKRAGISRQKLFTENYFAVFPKDFALQPVENLIQLSHRLQFIRYSSRSVIGAQIQSYLDNLGVEIERNFEFDATDPLLSLVAAGLGWAIITPLCLWQSRHHLDDVTVIPLNRIRSLGKPCPPLERSFYMLWRKEELQKIPNYVKEIVNEVASRQLTKEISAKLNIEENQLFTFE